MNSTLNEAHQSAPKRGGCLLPLLAVLLALGLIVLGGGFFAMRLASDKIITQVSQPAPVSLPTLALTPDQIEDAQARIRDFIQAVEKDQPGAALVLRGQELQAVLSAQPGEDWKPFQDKVFISIEQDHVRCDVSFPVPRILFKEYPGKYINGHLLAKFRNTPDGAVQVYVESAKMGDLDVPRDMLQGGGLNLMELSGGGKKGLEALERFVRKISKVEISGGTLQATLR
jgi:hypothetical protein